MKNLLYTLLILSLSIAAQAQFIPDSSFHQDGFINSNKINNGLLRTGIQSNDKIIVARNKIIRYHQNGDIDSSFANNGVIDSLPFAMGDMLIQPDDKIVLAGTTNGAIWRNLTMCRYLPNGSLDTTFGNKGITIDPSHSITNLKAKSLAIQKDGKIVLAGESFSTTQGSFMGSSTFGHVKRFHNNGSLDTSFKASNIRYMAELKKVFVQSTGHIVACGLDHQNSYSFLMVRLDSNGTLVSSKKPSNNGSAANADGIVTMLTNDKIIWAEFGLNFRTWRNETVLIKLLPNGDLDTTFGVYNTAIKSKGTIFINKRIAPSVIPTKNSLIIGFTNGALLITDTNGIVKSICNSGNYADSNATSYQSLLLQKDGKILTAGYKGQFYLGRFHIANKLLRTNKKACDSHQFNGSTLSKSGKYTRTTNQTLGCDTIEELNLTVNHSDSVYHSNSNCYSYTYLSNTYTQTGKYTDTLQNIYGCDSVIHLDVVIHPRQSSSLKNSNCYSVSFNNKTYNSTGLYQDTLQSQFGCDSIINLDVTVHQADSSTIIDEACDVYSFNGKNYASTGLFKDTLQTQFGCDSIVTIDIEVHHIDSSVTQSTNTLSAVSSGLQYQWINCETGNVISGETNQTYQANSNGDFAVVISDGNCSDTSACFSVRGVGINGQQLHANGLSVYPNPSNGTFTVDLSELKDVTSVEVLNLQGQAVYESSITNGVFEVNLNEPKGSYMLRVYGTNFSFSKRLLIH